MLEAQGIARGKGVPSHRWAFPRAHRCQRPPYNAAQKQTPNPASIAAEIADRFFGSSTKKKTRTRINRWLRNQDLKTNRNLRQLPRLAIMVLKNLQTAAKAPIEMQVFVSENDVRRAMTRSEKIFISRKTILTPSARDLGLEHEVFVETETGSLR